MLTKSKWGGGCFSPLLVVFYQLISNTWSHANPLTPLAVSAHTNRNKHTETHYINCLSSPVLILKRLPSPLSSSSFPLYLLSLPFICFILKYSHYLSHAFPNLFHDNPFCIYLSASRYLHPHSSSPSLH